MRIGSLFSGIGGLELGLEQSGIGHTVWQVEQSQYCRDVLARHWPGVAQYDDVCKVGVSNLEPVELICGGFPCQDVSGAGKGAGLAGARSGLWYEFLRIVEELHPNWVVVENVASGAKRWVDNIRGDLGRSGYETIPVPISAADCGAPHRRARIFVIGVTTHNHSERSRTGGPRGLTRRGEGETDEASQRVSANSNSNLQWQSEPGRPERASRQGTARVVHHSGWTSEPCVARVVHGLSGRVDREKALGNSVVPQCAEVIGHIIQELLK
jgi:DNA (cytosine-5)-methyltransferase 1